MKIIESHTSIKFVTDINAVCTNFFQKTNLSYFAYIRVYKSGHILSLPTNVNWHKYYFEQEYHKNIMARLGSGKRFWSSNSIMSKAFIDSKNLFGIDNKFEITTDLEDYWEIVSFGSNIGNNDIINLYLNHQELLINFKYFFLEKMHKIIELSSQKINLINIDIKLNNIRHSNELGEFSKLMQSDMKRVYLPNGEDYLTKQELKCLLMSFQNNSSVEIAQGLGISEKTVRYYLDSVKIKFNESTKAGLLKKAKKIGLHEIILKN